MAETPSKTQILLARLVIVLMIAFAAVGVFWYGLSEEVRHRVWDQLIARPTGPMAFRFILQPIMAAIAALRDGVNDAKSRRFPYFWTLLTNPFEGGHRLYEGLRSAGLIFLWASSFSKIVSPAESSLRSNGGGICAGVAKRRVSPFTQFDGAAVTACDGRSRSHSPIL